MGAGAGAAGYTFYKVNEFSKDVVPDWLKDSLGQAKDWVSNMELKNFDLKDMISWTGVDPSSIKLPTVETPNVTSTAGLPGMDQAAKAFDAMTGPSVAMAALPTKPATTAGPGRSDEDLMVLTKKLIEVRNLLKTVSDNTDLKLPSIVVIGSQSSGKSSVLESIVGHEFLPKGNNMVTRRPIELTLVHTPGSNDEYGEFPQLGLGKISDFKHIQKTLTDLNMAVPETECVSASPIELKIYSKNVPDLTMVDLPGFIQVVNRNQPTVLKEKIADLCETYIREPNIILAVCAADVDLANSEALRASKKADPMGLRTIGVITKVDLVEPGRAIDILTNTDYPLQLGYVGVICKASGVGKGPSQALIRAEDAYFKNHDIFRKENVSVTTPVLRRRLMEVLEEHMGRGLYRIVDAVDSKLDDARYQFKVHYNDRKISPESYVAEAMDSLKTRFRAFTKEFGKPQVREQVRAMLEQRILEICDEVYWNDPRAINFPKICMDNLWQTRLDLTSAALTKSGVGRSSVQLVVDILMENMERIASSEQWANHPETRKKILQFSHDILRSKFHTTVDQVENTIKPFKFEVECSEQEWQEGVKRASTMLENALQSSQKQLQGIKSTVGRRKLRNAVRYLQKQEREEALKAAESKPNELIAKEDPKSAPAANNNSPVLENAKKAMLLQKKILTLQSRIAAVKSRPCARTSGKSCCPEVHLEVVAEKMTYNAVMFIYVELLNEFFFQLPREVDNKLYYDLSRQQILQFAKENPVVAKHLEVQERKETLELVMEKLKGLSRRH
ncbi:dynamin-like GTPase mgm1 [Blyttiomyces sp. JEL0837]|nr:dynamin-like GTPase mgm1 [Blyttiomyces sp. JEL0837]